MFVTVKNGRAHLYNDSGTPKCVIGQSGAVSASICESGEYVLVVYESGKAVLYTNYGAGLRTVVTKGALSGSMTNAQMAIQMDNGKTQLRRVPSGILLRTV